MFFYSRTWLLGLWGHPLPLPSWGSEMQHLPWDSQTHVSVTMLQLRCHLALSCQSLWQSLFAMNFCVNKTDPNLEYWRLSFSWYWWAGEKKQYIQVRHIAHINYTLWEGFYFETTFEGKNPLIFHIVWRQHSSMVNPQHGHSNIGLGGLKMCLSCEFSNQYFKLLWQVPLAVKMETPLLIK